jgi:hypothetical protein
LQALHVLRAGTRPIQAQGAELLELASPAEVEQLVGLRKKHDNIQSLDTAVFFSLAQAFTPGERGDNITSAPSRGFFFRPQTRAIAVSPLKGLEAAVMATASQA